MSVTEIGSRAGSAKDDTIVEDGEGDLHPDEAEVLGKSIEDAAADGQHEEPEEGEQMQFPGTQTKLSTTLGGPKPTSSLAKIAAISLPMKPDEQMGMDEEVIVTLRCSVTFGGIRVLKKGGRQREHTLTPIELIEVRSE